MAKKVCLWTEKAEFYKRYGWVEWETVKYFGVEVVVMENFEHRV